MPQTLLASVRVRRLGVGLSLLVPEISLLNFYPPHMGERPAYSTSAPLLTSLIDVVSLIL